MNLSLSRSDFVFLGCQLSFCYWRLNDLRWRRFLLLLYVAQHLPVLFFRCRVMRLADQSLKVNWAVRTGLLIGTLTTIIMLPFALFFGMVAGYFSGIIDDVT